MPTRYYSAIAQDTTLTGNITNSDTSMVVGSTVGFPSNYPYILAVDYNASSEELVKVTGASGLTLTIERHFNGTSAVAHVVGAVVRHVSVAQDFTDMQNHYDATTTVHGIADTSALATKTGTETFTNKTLTAPKVNIALNAQTGTTYTLVAADQDKLVTLSNASAITLTIPSGVFSTGNIINIQQIGVGQVTIQGDGTSTFTGTGTKLRAQYSAAAILCTGSNIFTLIGDIN